MDERRNNLGRQFTNDPHFGNVYPNTQYKGYADGETEPFGGPSAPRLNQNPGSRDINNVRLHGGTGVNPNIPRSQYNPDYQSGQYQGSTTPGGANFYQGAAYQGSPLQQGGQQKGTQYNDLDRVKDLLSSEKHLAELYNIGAFEASNPQLQNTLIGLLNETHSSRELLQRTMEQRGWYKTEPADQQMVLHAQNQFANYRNQLPF